MGIVSRAAAVLLWLTLAAPGTAQTRDQPAGRGAVRPSDAATLAAGWNALSAGQVDAAERNAARILARRPWDHSAMSLRIEALSQTDPIKGLDAYEAWLGKRTRDDAALLEPVPRAIVLQMTGSTEPDLRHEAVRLLSAAAVPIPAGARDAVDQLTDAATRARLGDPSAITQMQTAMEGRAIDAGVIAQALESAGPPATPLLMKMLASTAGPARGAAAAALGRRKAEDARPALQTLLRDPDPFVRSSAAVALARMGDAQGQSMVDRMLQSEVPDLRLMAAEAWDGQDGPWVAVIMPLLDNRDGTTRLDAARLIAHVNPEAARRALHDAAADRNPVIRSEATRIMEQVAGDVPEVADPGQLRRLLRDGDPTVRLRAAGTLLALVRAGS